MSEILSREGSLSIAYQLRLDGESARVWFVSLLPTPLVASIYRVAPQNSALVVPLQPQGIAAAFIRGSMQSPQEVAAKCLLKPREAHLLAVLLPLLTRMVFPEDILARAVKWQKEGEYDLWSVSIGQPQEPLL